MCLKRRTLVLGIPAFLASPAVAGDAALAPLREYERASGGHIGIYAKNISSGATFAWRAHDRFVMCSTVKASLVAFVLSEIDRGHDDLDEMIHYSAADTGDLYAPVARANLPKGVLSVRDMCRAAVEVSDNVCCNLLLKRVGGPLAMTAF